VIATVDEKSVIHPTKLCTGDYLWERAMPAIFRAHGALPQWIGERLLLPLSDYSGQSLGYAI